MITQLEQQKFFQDSKGQQWFLHEKVTKRKSKIRFFSKDATNSILIPVDTEIIVSKTGLPFLRKIVL